MKLFKKRSESKGVIFKRHVDFGYRSSSPIPSQKTGQNNHSAAVLAIPGSYGERTIDIDGKKYVPSHAVAGQEAIRDLLLGHNPEYVPSD